jgi:hypothetical protein
MAATFVLRHIIGLLETYHSLFERGVLFIVVLEANLYTFSNEFCNKLMNEAAVHERQAYENLRREFNSKGRKLKLSHRLLDHIRIYHDATVAMKRFDKENEQASLSTSSEMDTLNWIQVLERVIPPRGTFLLDSAGMFGTNTTSILKNQGFSRFAASVLHGNVDFDPRFTSVTSMDVTQQKQLGPNDIINLILHEMEILPKKPNISSRSKGPTTPVRVLEHRPGQIMYTFGKSAKAGIVDDFPTIFALLFSAAHNISLLCALTTTAPGAQQLPGYMSHL